MVATLTDIEESQKISCLTGRGKHGCRAALHGCDLGCHMVIGGVLESGIEISGSLRSKEFSMSSLVSYLKVVDWMMGICCGSPFPGL